MDTRFLHAKSVPSWSLSVRAFFLEGVLLLLLLVPCDSDRISQSREEFVIVRHGSRELSAEGREEPGGCPSFSLRLSLSLSFSLGGEGAPGGRQRPRQQGTALTLTPRSAQSSVHTPGTETKPVTAMLCHATTTLLQQPPVIADRRVTSTSVSLPACLPVVTHTHATHYTPPPLSLPLTVKSSAPPLVRISEVPQRSVHLNVLVILFFC